MNLRGRTPGHPITRLMLVSVACIAAAGLAGFLGYVLGAPAIGLGGVVAALIIMSWKNLSITREWIDDRREAL